jgi:hypothetical protein
VNEDNGPRGIACKLRESRIIQWSGCLACGVIGRRSSQFRRDVQLKSGLHPSISEHIDLDPAHVEQVPLRHGRYYRSEAQQQG